MLRMYVFLSDPYGCREKKRKLDDLMKSFPSFTSGPVGPMDRKQGYQPQGLNSRIKYGEKLKYLQQHFKIFSCL